MKDVNRIFFVDLECAAQFIGLLHQAQKGDDPSKAAIKPARTLRSVGAGWQHHFPPVYTKPGIT